MTTLDNVSGLVERLEGLAGPCREVDAQIALLAGWELLKIPCQNINGSTEIGELWISPNCDEDLRNEIIGDYRSNVAANLWPESKPPAFTASIDAAMTLVGDDAWHEIKGPRRFLNIPTSVPNYWSAHLASWNHESSAMGWAATPAIALCIASLRAISERQSNG